VSGDYATALRRCKKASDLDIEYLSTKKSDVERIKRRKRIVKFLADYVTACNSLCMLFACVAQKELDALPSNSLAT